MAAFDKVLLSMDGSIGGLFLLVKGILCIVIFCIEKQGLAMRLGKGGGAVSALLRNQLTFLSSHSAREHL